jgi:hypothetical protein
MRVTSGASPSMVTAPTGVVGHDEASVMVGLAWVTVYRRGGEWVDWLGFELGFSQN